MILNKDYKEVDLSDIKIKPNLFIVDPPYGEIVKDKFDQTGNYLPGILTDIMKWAEKYSDPGMTLYMFGGIGKYKQRHFFRFLSEIESKSKWRLHNLITWKKRRGYGTPYNYLYTREEIAMFVLDSKKPSYFSVPYLEEERSDAWKKRLEKQKIKQVSNKLRRSNVWSDINELFSGKVVSTQKPINLYKVLIETSCPKNGFVVDPMCGSGTTGIACKELARNFLAIEKNKDVYDIAKGRGVN